ncbi:alpha-2-macroglobulin family protein [Hyphobacterium sp.]|uniref:alpha-2-macroglobulin family protein n=1 Tax=Hyphobacterium sp. TaxID=2004662 RepID=UPI003BAA6CCE
MTHRALRWGFAAAASVSFVLAACSEPETGGTGPAEADGIELASRSASAPRPEPEYPDSFDYLRYRIDVSDAQPAACFIFSEALDPAVDYGPFVELDPPLSVALRVDGSTLCLGGLGFGDAPDVTLLEGLPSADGDPLQTSETTTVEFGDRPAYVGFSGDGIILPRIDADGIPIETVNVDEVSIQVLRINDRALAFRELTQGYTAAENEWGSIWGEESPNGVGRVIWEGTMDTSADPNAPNVTVMPLAETIGVLEPGAYFLRVRDNTADEEENRPARSERWFIITDLAITSYVGLDGIDVTVRSLQTGRPVDDVDVQLIAGSNEILADEQTGNDGQVRFDGPISNGSGANAPRLLVAYGPDGDFAMLDLARSPVDLSEHNTGGRRVPDGADAFLYLDRGIYRPGEIVHASALIRDREANAIEDRAGSFVLYAPNGIESDRLRFDGAAMAGGLQHEFAISPAAARGVWRLALELDGMGVVGRASFSVEDFVPQRIELSLNTDDATPLKANETRSIESNVRFLYGAPGAGLPIEGEVRIQTDPSPFDDFAGYRFGLHDRSFQQIAYDLPDTITDGAGRAILGLNTENRGIDATQPLRARVVVSAIEPGGRPVRDDVRIPYRPRDVYIGVEPDFEGRPERDAETRFNVISVDADGNLTDARLEWHLTRRDYRYDWYRESGGNWRWRRTSFTVPIESGVIETGGEISSVVTPPLDWGNYRLEVNGPDGIASSYGFWVGWGRVAQDGVEAPDRVRIATPEESPAIGSTAQISLQAPYAGEAEIVVATDRVIASYSMSLPEGGVGFTLPVTEDWGTGAYVMATVYTPRDAAAQPRPRRAVGVAYIPVNADERTIDIAFDMPELVRPRQTVSVELEASRNTRNAYVTLAAVDEGILLLTRFESPDPVDWYFGQRALDVALYDDYGRLLDPNQGAASPVRSGGDQIGGAGLTVVPTQTVALFSGPVEFNRQGRATLDIEVPDFNGELRLMAVAWSDEAIGSAAQPLTVRDPVPAELILPRFLAPGDNAEATLTIDNVEGEAGDYVAIFSSEGPVIFDQPRNGAAMEPGERRDAAVGIGASDIGIAQLSMDVVGPDLELGSSYPIQVRSPFRPISRYQRLALAPGENWSPNPEALAEFNPGEAELQISFSAIPMDAAAIYENLSRYPFGCTEQQASRAMPLLYADQMAALAGLDADEEIAVRVRDTVEVLLNRQSSDGAIGQWRMGDRYADGWLGAYATDFLARADDAGYQVPEAALERAYTVLGHIARGDFYRAGGYDTDIRRGPWQRDTQQRLNDRSQAYAFYVLARAGRVDVSRLRYFHDNRIEAIDSPLARAHIGAALAMAGDRSRSTNAFDLAEQALGYRNAGDYYQTPRRDLAGVLAMAAEAGDTDRVQRLGDRVATELPAVDRLTTQEMAFLLLAAHALTSEGDDVAVAPDGAVTVRTEGVSYAMSPADLGEGAVFTNEAGNPVWLTSVARGTPAQAPAAEASLLFVSKQIRNTDGFPADLSNVDQGDRFIISIEIGNPEQRRAPLIVADLLPAGFEIEAIVQPAEGGPNGPYNWLGEIDSARLQEARDDRYVAAVEVYGRRVERYAYIVRAVTPGRFTIPGVVVEDMYRTDVFARSEAGEVVIQAR